MFRLAVLSDVHADVHALTDAFVQIELLGCDELVCCGDLVDYGRFPNHTLELLRERGVACIRGNHDRRAAHPDSLPGGGWEYNLASQRFLSKLPRSWTGVREGVRVSLHHASPRGDMDGIEPKGLHVETADRFLVKAECDVLVVGHTHRAMRLDLPDGRMIVNPGALLRDPAPGEETPAAPGTFGVLELPSRKFRVYRAKDGVEVPVKPRRVS